jgi:hypothetical protein
MTNIHEQDHRYVKKRVAASQWSRSVAGALNTIAGYEAMNSIRKASQLWKTSRSTLNVRETTSSEQLRSAPVHPLHPTKTAVKIGFATQPFILQPQHNSRSPSA